MRENTQRLELHGEIELVDTSRKLLGRTTPFVGREREIGTLEAIVDECIAEPVTRVALVTGPGGIGKTRLRNELVARLADRGVEVWAGRADSMRTGSPFAVLAPALRRAAGLLESEPLEAKRRKLRARVARHVRAEDVPRVSEFVGEIVAVPFSDEASVQLRAARRDAVLMGDQVRRAFLDLVVAETRAQPLLLVLEDLQHGDSPSIELVDAALRTDPEKPLMVLALARPEIHDRFPRLFAERDVQEVRLGPLTRRAAERLVGDALAQRPLGKGRWGASSSAPPATPSTSRS